MKGSRRRKAARPLSRRQVIRAVLVTGGLALLAFAIGVWSLLNVIDQRTRDSNKTIHALADALTRNRDKLVAVGQQPVGPPPDQIVGAPGPAGAAGPAGQPGTTGPPGRDGVDGRDATPAQVAAAVAAYMRAHPVPTPTASPGRDGRDGADGQSPACLAEPDQCQGAEGPAGPAGERGPPGTDGQPPSAWTWVDPATGVRYDCQRDPTSPDTAPAYSCKAA